MTTALSDLTQVRRADVYKADHKAGTLTRETSGNVFRYLDDYDGPLVASTLPRGEPILTPAGALPPFFAGLLPEGRRLTALRRSVKTSADDDLSLLLAVGEDMVGDVQVVADGEQPSDIAAVIEVRDFGTVTFREVFARAIGTAPDRVGLAGVQDKVSARMITMPVAHRADRYILKLNPPEFPVLVENEAFFLNAARRSGINTVNTRTVRDAVGEVGLLVERFDRLMAADGALVRLAVEDACQALNRYPADKYSVTSEEVARALVAFADTRSVASRQLLQQFVFAYLTGNGDAHAKNFAVLRAVDGDWRISPAFDLPTSYVYGDTTMALSIGGRRRENITRSTMLHFAATLGLPAAAAGRVIDELCAAFDGWIGELDTLPFDAGRLRKLRRAITYRRERLAR